MRAGEPHREASPAGLAPERLEHRPVRLPGQPRVGVQEHEYVPGRDLRSRVHLAGAPARGGENPVRAAGRPLAGPVGTAPVGDDDLVPALAKRAERFERGPDAVRFVEDRHHDGEPAPDRIGSQFSAPPQLLPCPAVQP